MNDNRNIILIGMPGSGKSTVGVILAKMMSRPYLDSDILIQLVEKRSLQDIVDTDGHMALRQIEENVLLDISCHNHIVATGGSAAYSSKAMAHLKNGGIIVFLDADLPTLTSRISNYETRGLAKRSDQTFEDLYQERLELYRKYADITVTSKDKNQEEIADELMRALKSFSPA